MSSTATRIFSGEYKLIHSGISKMIEESEEELLKIEAMVKDPGYIYMTKEVAWRHTEPINERLKNLYRLQDKLTMKRETFYISE